MYIYKLVTYASIVKSTLAPTSVLAHTLAEEPRTNTESMFSANSCKFLQPLPSHYNAATPHPALPNTLPPPRGSMLHSNSKLKFVLLQLPLIQLYSKRQNTFFLSNTENS